jgi:hypothetical protein
MSAHDFNVPAFFHDFSTTIPQGSFDEACRTLDVRPKDSLKVGFSRRSLSGVVGDRYGGQSWLKLTAMRVATSFFREGEITAPRVDGVDSPKILRVHDWTDSDLYFRALQTSLAPSPAIELTPLAATNAALVTDTWIAQFKKAVHRFQAVQTSRYRAQPQAAAAHIRSWFGAEAPCEADDYCAAHGDANWSNVTAPNLAFLDWEVWGLAPRGFDLAYLVAFSCIDPKLTHRLETAFADELSSKAGQVSLLICIGEILNLIKEGILPASCRAPAMRMAQRVLDRWTSTKRSAAGPFVRR